MSESEESNQASQESLFAYKKVCNWDCDDVSKWMKGLNESLSRHVPQFMAHSISGNDLLKLSRQQLEYLKVTQIGHQELLLEAVELLASVDNSRSRQSTISMSSNLSKKTSQLVKAFTTLRRAKQEDYQAALLDCMETTATVLQSSKFLIGWLDRYPTELIENYRTFRQTILDNTFALSSSMDSDEVDIQKMTTACSTILKLTGGMMSPELFGKPDPVTLVTVTLVPNEDKGLGFSIQRTRRGALVITQIQQGSPANRCGQIMEGVELIQINEQNIVYWDVKNVVKCLRSCGHEVVLTLRVSNSRLMRDSIDGSQEMLCDHQYSPPTRPLRPKPANLHLALERVSSSPAIIRDKPEKGPRPPTSLPLSPQVVNHKWERIQEQPTPTNGIDSVPYVRKKSHSMSGTLDPATTEQMSAITSPEPAVKPLIAYRTEIIGGVVHKIPIQPQEDGSVAPPKVKKNSSLRRKPRGKQRSSSLSDPLTISKHPGATPTSPLVTSPLLTFPPGLNEGGDMDQGKAIFSDPTNIILEGKATKQVTVSSGTESPRISRDGILRTSGKKANPDLLVPCFQLKNPDFEGWVSKLGGSGFTPKNWRRRWFVLKDEKLYYYKTSFDISALGIVCLPGYNIEQALELKKKNGFKATKQGARTYYFFTDTAEEMLRWMDALTKASTSPVPTDSANAGINPSIDSCDDKSVSSD